MTGHSCLRKVSRRKVVSGQDGVKLFDMATVFTLSVSSGWRTGRFEGFIQHRKKRMSKILGEGRPSLSSAGDAVFRYPPERERSFPVTPSEKIRTEPSRGGTEKSTAEPL
jgi:hypothetical protein